MWEPILTTKKKEWEPITSVSTPVAPSPRATQAIQEAQVAEQQAQKANSFGGLLKNTLTGLTKVTPKQVVKAAGSAVGGILPGAKAAYESVKNGSTQPYKTYLTETNKKTFPSPSDVTIVNNKPVYSKEFFDKGINLALGVTGGGMDDVGNKIEKGILNKFKKPGVVEGDPIQTLKNVEARVGVKPTQVTKRIGVADSHSSYTPRMKALIKEAQDKGELFPYTKFTPEEQQIQDRAFREEMSKFMEGEESQFFGRNKVMTPAEKESIAQETRKKLGMAPELMGDLPYHPKEVKYEVVNKNKVNPAEYDEGYFKKKPVELPEHLQKKSNELDMKEYQLQLEKEALDNDPISSLKKFEAKSGDYKGGLPEVGAGGKSKFAKRGDYYTDTEELGNLSSEEARAAYDEFKYKKETLKINKEALKREREALKQEIKQAKKPLLAKENQIDPLTREARKYKSAEEFRKSLAKGYSYGFDLKEKPISEIISSHENIKNEALNEYISKIKNHEYFDPIIINSEGEIMNGNHRLEAYKKLGFERVPVLSINPALKSGEINGLVDIWKKANKKPHLKFDEKGYPLAYTAREKAIVNANKQGFSSVGEVLKDTGETRTLERVAQETLTKDTGRNNGGILSLPKTIDKLPTPVKNKVGLLDSWRTEDRVMKKIGLEKEMDLIRKSKEAADMELPKNVQKVTDWSKQVPKESNQRIFKWLDGQAIDLRPDEEKVAREIKSWLADWARRLNLPDDNKITHYITHIFDDQIIAKEFDEDLAKIIADKVPGEVYDPFLQKRLGAKGYIEDTWAALDAYAKRATRKVHMDPALAKLEDAAGRLEESQWDFVKNYADRINMRPTKWDTGFDNTFKQLFGYRFGQRPINRISRNLRQITFRGMLGGNIGSAMRNISQGVNTYAKLGERYTARGYMDFVKNGTEELYRVGVLNNNFIEDRALSATKKFMERVDKKLFVFFDTAEKINRGAAYYGAKAKALNKGMTEEEAIEFAKKLVRDTQFSYSTIDTPLALQGDLAKIFTQFMSYPVKQTEFLVEMAQNKEFAGLARYALGGLAFTYTIGQAFGMDPKEFIPFSGYFTGDQKFGPPPSLKLPTEIAKAVINAPDKFGNQRTMGEKASDVGKTALGWIPGGIQGKKTIEGVKAFNQGAGTSATGRVRYPIEQTLTNRIKTGLFGQYATQEAKDYFEDEQTPLSEKQSQEVLNSDNPKETFDRIKAIQAENKVKETQRAEHKAKIQPVFDQALNLVKSGDTAGAEKLVNELSDEDFEVYKDIRSSWRSGNTTKTRELLSIKNASEAVKFLRSLPQSENERIVNLLTDEEYSLLLKGKNEYSSGADKTQFIEFAPLAGKKAIDYAVPKINGKETPWAKNLAEEVKKSFPFSPQALSDLSDTNYKEMNFDRADQGGEYRPKGEDIYHFVNKFLPSKWASWARSVGKGLDKPSIIVRKDLEGPIQGVMAHEMLHRLFDASPYGFDDFENKSDLEVAQRFGPIWIEEWDKLSEKASGDSGQYDPDYDVLWEVDEHLKQSGYDLNNPYSVATERFAYLGQKALHNGIEVIPPELRKYYIGIIKGAEIKSPAKSKAPVMMWDKDQRFQKAGNNPHNH